jgi:predicted Rossmann-fold nucleotide-binding protein
MKPRQRIAAFGSSRTPPESPEYADVRKLATRLAACGWDGITGGHQGMMAAFSEGMHAGGGHIRGVTLERFPTPPGNSLHEEIRARNFFERMQTMIEDADAYLVLPGGLGTLAELAMTWDLLAIRVLEARPLLVFGRMWEPVLQGLREHLCLSVEHAFDSIHTCRNHDEVLTHLARFQH